MMSTEQKAMQEFLSSLKEAKFLAAEWRERVDAGVLDTAGKNQAVIAALDQEWGKVELKLKNLEVKYPEKENEGGEV